MRLALELAMIACLAGLQSPLALACVLPVYVTACAWARKGL